MAESRVTYRELDSPRLMEQAAEQDAGLFPGIQVLIAQAVEAGVPHFDATAARSFARLDDPEGFKAGRIDPNLDVGRSLRSGQTLRNSSMVLAYYDDMLVGYAHGANTVSGSPFAQFVKRQGHRHQFSQIRDFAVKPEFQRQTIGAGLAYRIVRSIDPELKNPVSAYAIVGAVGANALIDAVTIQHDAFEPEEMQTPDGRTSYYVQRKVAYHPQVLHTIAHGIANADRA